MVHEIFIVEDKNELTKDLLVKFKGDKEIHLDTVSFRKFIWALAWHTIFNNYKWKMLKGY